MPDSLLLAYLQASDENIHQDLATEGRSDSALSLASTIDALHSPSAPPVAPPLLIKTFCTMNGLFLTIEMPNLTSNDGWVYRNDLGGQSHHRWEYKKTLILLSRHTTCKKAIDVRRPCRNCMMKEVWRRECTEPENTFFLCPMGAADDLTPAMNEIMLDCAPATPEQVAIYSKNVPKISVTRKRPFDEATKDKQIFKLHQQILSRRRAENRNDISNATIDADFYNLVGDALGLDRCDSNDSELAMLGAPPDMFPATSPIAQSMTSLETPCDDLCVAYEALVNMFLKSSTTEVVMTSDVIAQMQHDFPRIYRTDAATEQSAVLADALFMLNVNAQNSLMMKAIFPTWMSRLRSRCASGPIKLGLGFYHAPSAAIFQDICSNAAVTHFMASGHHRIDSPTVVAASLTILVIYVMDAKRSLIAGNDILPLSSLA